MSDVNVDLNPNFQRIHVWTLERKQQYIEFRLRGGGSGNILYWNYPKWQKISVIM